MRVALIALSVRGAMGQYLEALATELSKRVELHLFAPKHFGVAELGSAVVHPFVTGSSRVETLARLLNPFAAFAVWRQIQAIGPDILHLLNGEGYPWSLLWARWASQDRLPFVVSLHDPEPHPGNVWEGLNARFRRYVLKQACSVHVHSQCFVEAATAQGARAVKVIPHGSLAGRFLCHRKEGIEREPLVLFFGRIEAYKGLDLLIKAGISFGGKLRVAIAGPGRLPQALLAQIQAHPEIFELHNRYLADWEVAQLFQRASVCVLPYRQATQSSVPLIAAAFGVPVVAAAVGGFTEDVPRVRGLLVPPGNPEALAEAIRQAVWITPTYPQELEFTSLAEEFVAWYARPCKTLA